MAKAKARIVTKKKQWVKILAPPAFNSIELGETYVGEKREAIGKSLSVNIMNLGMGGYRRQNIDVTFKVTGLHDEKAVTEFIGYQIIPSAIKRMIRRGKNKVEDSFVVKTADNHQVKIKPLLVTRSKTTGSVQTVLRKTLKQFIINDLAKRRLDDFAKELVGHRFQKLMYDVCSKVHPLSTCEVRWAQVTTERTTEKAEVKAKAPEEVTEEVPAEKLKEEKTEEAQADKPKAEKEASVAEAETSETTVSERAQKAKLSDMPAEKKEVEENAEASN